MLALLIVRGALCGTDMDQRFQMAELRQWVQTVTGFSSEYDPDWTGNNIIGPPRPGKAWAHFLPGRGKVCLATIK